MAKNSFFGSQPLTYSDVRHVECAVIPPSSFGGAVDLLNRATMTIDLDRIRANFARLKMIAPRADCAAVVKGDAYGHGMLPCAKALIQCGARTFFVATSADGAVLRSISPEITICVLSGILPGEEGYFIHHDLIPVLNDLGQIELWATKARKLEKKLDAYLHFDSGMNRLGLTSEDAELLGADDSAFKYVHPLCYMSHLSAADDLDFDNCERQRTRFLSMISKLPHANLSLANSAASYFGRQFTLDMYRPGKATFGINPATGRANPMQQPATLHAPLIQLKNMRRSEAVGYSSTFRLSEQSRIATVGIGYTNGYPRTASNRAHVSIRGFQASVIGRVSMDLITVDVSSIPERLLHPGAPVEILGPNISDSILANSSGTIEHDVLISLGRGSVRQYINL